MTLIGESRQQCGIGRRLTGGEVAPSEANPQLQKISMRGCPNLTKETAQKLETADAGQRRQLLKRGGQLRCSLESLDGLRDGRRKRSPARPVESVPQGNEH